MVAPPPFLHYAPLLFSAFPRRGDGPSSSLPLGTHRSLTRRPRGSAHVASLFGSPCLDSSSRPHFSVPIPLHTTTSSVTSSPAAGRWPLPLPALHRPGGVVTLKCYSQFGYSRPLLPMLDYMYIQETDEVAGGLEAIRREPGMALVSSASLSRGIRGSTMSAWACHYFENGVWVSRGHGKRTVAGFSPSDPDYNQGQDANNKNDHDCSCSGCDYVIVARDCDYGYESPSYLWMYHSKTEHWSFKPVQAPAGYDSHVTSKTITIGEEVAWVDLSRDIIFCDVLAETPRCHVVSLPLPIKKLHDPRTVRDIAILDGCIYYVELQHQINKDGTLDCWSATKWSKKITSPTKWSKKITSPLEGWDLDHKVDSDNISGSSKLEGNAHLAQPDLWRLFLGLPSLSFQDNDVVYCLAKIQYWDNEQTAWVIGVDLRNKTIHEVAEYNATKTLGLSIGYSASRISKYLRSAPATCLHDALVD